MRKFFAVVASVAVALVTLVMLATAAAATPQQTIEVSWVTSHSTGSHLPTKPGTYSGPQYGADDVNWPQRLLAGDAPCGAVVQVDRYLKSRQAEVDALVANGTLNKPGSPHWTDSAFVVSWKFVVEEQCTSQTPSPSPTLTSEQPSPSPSSATPTATHPTSSPSAPSSPPASTTPSGSASTTSTATPTSGPSATPTTPPTPTLPMTGHGIYGEAAAAIGLVGSGALLLASVRRKRIGG